MRLNGGFGLLGHLLEEAKKTDRKVFWSSAFASHWLEITVNMFLREYHETWIHLTCFQFICFLMRPKGKNTAVDVFS